MVIISTTSPVSGASDFYAFDANSLEVIGAGTTSGVLSGLLIDEETTGGQSPNPAFVLSSASAKIDAVHAEFNFGETSAITSTERLHEGKARIVGLENRAGAHFWLTPLGKSNTMIDIESVGCTSIEPPQFKQESRSPVLDANQDDVTVDASHSAVVDSCTDLVAIIRGDFSIIAWEWDMSVNSNRINSGVDDLTRNHGLPESALGSADELYITAINATLSIPLSPESYWLFIDAPRIETRNVILKQATGSLPGVLESVESEDVELVGDFSILIQSVATNVPLSALISGSTEEASLGHAPLTIRAPAPPSAGINAMTLWSVALVLVVGFVLVRYGRPLVVAHYHLDTHIKNGAGFRARLSRGISIMADAHLERRKFKRSERLARRAARVDQTNPWALFILGASLMHQEKFSEALKQNRASQTLATNRRMKAYVVMGEAEIHASTGDQKRASDALIQARILDAKAAAKASQNTLWGHFPFQGLITLIRSGNTVGGDCDYHQ